MPHPTGLTLADLERSTCACGGDDCSNNVIFLHGKCHPSAAAEVSYTKGEGKLVIKCAECKRLVAEVAVASVN
jgi:hypothetical protein